MAGAGAPACSAPLPLPLLLLLAAVAARAAAVPPHREPRTVNEAPARTQPPLVFSLGTTAPTPTPGPTAAPTHAPCPLGTHTGFSFATMGQDITDDGCTPCGWNTYDYRQTIAENPCVLPVACGLRPVACLRSALSVGQRRAA